MHKFDEVNRTSCRKQRLLCTAEPRVLVSEREGEREREGGREREREREGVMLADFNHNIIINSAWCGPQATVVGTYGRLNIYTSDSRIHSTSQAGMGWPINYFRMTRACGIII